MAEGKQVYGRALWVRNAVCGGRAQPDFGRCWGTHPRPFTYRKSAVAQVLVIDDNESIRHFIAELLEAAGHSVSLADDGEAAAQHYRARSFDLVITDLEMPRRGGLEVIEELKGDFPQCKVIAVTGAPKGSVDRALELGADYVLLKPFKIGVFLQAVQTLIAGPGQQG
jgi:CheY-like chemotaxis protein